MVWYKIEQALRMLFIAEEIFGDMEGPQPDNLSHANLAQSVSIDLQ